MAKIGTTTVAPGATVGLFSVAGATVASSDIRVNTTNNNPFKIVGAPNGTGPSFSFDARGSYLTSEELYLKNVSDEPASITVLVIPR